MQGSTKLTHNGALVSPANPLPVAVGISPTAPDAEKPMTEATGQALLAAIGAAGDAAGANTVIGQLKQIAINTAA